MPNDDTDDNGHVAPDPMARMDLKRLLAAAPATLRVSSARPSITLQRDVDLVALHDAPRVPDEAMVLERGLLVVGVALTTADDLSSSAGVGPVYRHGEGGRLAVPTGRVLVRFKEGDVTERREALEAAGYRLESVLGHAPCAGWFRSTSGGIVGALRDIERLEVVPGVVSVEPQMVGERHRRPEGAPPPRP